MLKHKGFTIVELLIVIVVIAILASITIVAYNGIQNRAKDAQIRAVAKQFSKAFQQWSVQSGKVTAPGGSGSTAYSGGVCTGGGGGWVTRTVSYTCTIDQILVDDGLIPPGLVLSVPVTNGAYTTSAYSVLMLYGCPTTANTSQYAMMYHLNTADDAEATTIRNTCAGGGGYGPIDTYKMNGGFIFNLSS